MILTAGKFVPAPEGTHQGVLCDVVDIGEKENSYGQVKHFIKLVFQLDVDMENGKPFIVSQQFNATLHEKGALRKFLQAMRGKAFTPDELKEFESDDLLGTNAQISVIHAPGKNGGIYANISSVAPHNPKLGEPLEIRDYVRVQDRTEDTDSGKF